MIYEIVCNETGERYIGSTFEPTVARRIAKHREKTNKCISKQIIDRDNYSYGLLEKVDVETRDELRMCERKWYDSLDCINKQRPYCSLDELKESKKEYDKEYHEQNKDKIKAYQEQNRDKTKEYKKAYYKQNRDKTKEYNKEYYERKKQQNI
jgi:hypothetical protein